MASESAKDELPEQQAAASAEGTEAAETTADASLPTSVNGQVTDAATDPTATQESAETLEAFPTSLNDQVTDATTDTPSRPGGETILADPTLVDGQLTDVATDQPSGEGATPAQEESCAKGAESAKDEDPGEKGATSTSGEGESGGNVVEPATANTPRQGRRNCTLL